MSQLVSVGSGVIPPGTYVETLTGNSGTAVADGSGNINTLGSSGITTTGAGSTMTIELDIPVSIAHGGTNATSMATTDGTVYFDGTRLVTTATGTVGQILTSAGAGVAPSYQNPAASSISITGNSGGTLTGDAFTFTGGTTGLTLAGSGSTETLGGTLVIANGGTNATSFTQSNGIVTYNGTSLVNYAGPQIDSSGRNTNTTQPAFAAYHSASPANVTGDGTFYTCLFDTEIFDQGGNFASNTFTAPVTGKYFFGATIGAYNLTTAFTLGNMSLVTTSNTFFSAYASFATTGAGASNGVIMLAGSWIVNMTAGDTAYLRLAVFNGTKIVGYYGGAVNSYFSGYLVC